MRKREDINQCDGCRARKPLDENGNHVMGDPNVYPDLMGCQKDKYAPKTAAILEQAVRLGIPVLIIKVE